MTLAVAVYAGVIVRNLPRSLEWYQEAFGVRHGDSGADWASLYFPDGSMIELLAGDPADPAGTFPSYRGDSGPSVMPGYSYEEPEEVAAGLLVQRRLPEWIVVRAPDGLRLVLTSRDGDGSGLVGFHFTSPAPEEQRPYLDAMGVPDPVTPGDRVLATPVVRGTRDEDLTDPDGTAIAVRVR